MKMLRAICFVGLAAVLAVPGCSWREHRTAIDNSYGDATKRVDDSITTNDRNNNNPLVRKAGGVWLGGKPIAMKKKEDLPAVFGANHKITLMEPERMNISSVAEKITKITGVRVRVNPDVFIPASDLNPSGSSTTTQPQAAAAAAPSGSSSTMTGDFDTTMTINYEKGSLIGLLDMVAARSGVSWRYEEKEIIFYRFATKTFSLKAIPGTADISASVGKAGSASTTSGKDVSNTGVSASNFSSSTETKAIMTISVWAGIENAIRAMMTPLGKLSISQATGTIVVTDVPQVINQVSSLLDHENRLLTRQVNFKVEMIQINLTDEDQFGINWNAVYNQISEIAGKSWRLSATGPVMSISENAADIGFSVLTSDTDNPVKFEGSRAIFQALSTLGKVHDRRSVSLTTTNNQPAPFALTSQTGYLAKIEAASVTTDAATGSPGLTPGIVTTGFIMNVTPTILDNSKILLHFSLDNSRLESIDKKSSGGNTIETPVISSEQILQRLVLRSNETVIIAPYESERGAYDSRSLDRNLGVAAGGSFDGRSEKTVTIILITPTLLEGA